MGSRAVCLMLSGHRINIRVCLTDETEVKRGGRRRRVRGSAGTGPAAGLADSAMKSAD